jgi:hypothetical protein
MKIRRPAQNPRICVMELKKPHPPFFHFAHPKFLWGDEGDPEVAFIVVNGKYIMIARPELPLVAPFSEDRR